MHDDQEVALRAQQGDDAAFEALVRRYEEVAFRAAYLIVRNEADAQDVAQEAFVRAYRALNRFDAGQPFRPWLLRIIQNTALNSVRSARRRREAGQRLERDVGEGGHEPSPEASALGREQAERVWQAISGLPEQDQAVLYLRYFLDASEREAAAAIGRPVGTVKSRLHRALGRLRAVIDERYPDLAPLERGESRTKA